MLNLFIMGLFLLNCSLYASSDSSCPHGGCSHKVLQAGNVSAKPTLGASTSSNQSDAASEDGDVDDDDSDSTGEVDEDVIIDDEENSNDDEGVNN